MPEKTAATLLEALPYIREFSGKTVVIKYGGAAMRDAILKEDFARDVCLLKFVGINPVIVHGGGPEINQYMERLGMEVEFIDGLRVSDKETVEVVKMVLVGKLNKEIVVNLNRHGQPSVGLCGDDGSLFTASKRTAVKNGEEVDIGYIGRVQSTDVDTDLLLHVAEDYIPVIAPVSSGRDGNAYNVNADLVAGAVAGALRAEKLIVLTDVEGWLDDPEDHASLISKSDLSSVKQKLDRVRGGMRPKLEACIEAIEHGTSAAHIIDGRKPHSLLIELFTNAGIGSKISPDR